ncbi:MAG: hypothetical protein ING30_00010 [Burkholderiales bacterium]|nr:hypothetical protein [Burkholderiales bacterium]
MKITDYLAVYAAVLSTLVFLWNVLQSRPRIKVDLIFGIEGSGDAVTSGIYVFVRNLSSHDIHLSNIDILYPYTKPTWKERIAHAWRFKRLPKRLGWVHSSLSNYSVATGCPVCVEARQSHQVFIPQASVERVLADAVERSLMACAQDQLWNNAYSGRFRCSLPSSG